MNQVTIRLQSGYNPLFYLLKVSFILCLIFRNTNKGKRKQDTSKKEEDVTKI